ncbi:MAG: TPM domain-containing protein [bacterium]
MKGSFKKILSSIALGLFLVPSVIFAFNSPGRPVGFVNDFAVVLDDASRNNLELKLKNFEQITGNEISIVTIKSLNGDTVENYASELFKAWGIGKKNKDNGVLLLVSIEDRKMRIEVGYGLEGNLTDAQSSWIINQDIKPAFQRQDYYSGLNAAVDKIMSAVNGDYIPSESSSSKSGNNNFDLIINVVIFGIIILAAILGKSKSWWAGGVIGGIVGVIIFFLKGLFYGIIALIVLIPFGLLFDFIVSRAETQRQTTGTYPWWFGGGASGGGSGFGGFGGGSSGGGGASGSW